MTKESWERIRPKTNPFLKFEFFEALSKSSSIGQESGWLPLFIFNEQKDAALYTFIKSHSFGEYIFDWAWADAFQRYGVAYYPKLTSMIPFTPVSCSHFLMPEFCEKKVHALLQEYEEKYLNGPYSSSHFLFLEPWERAFFQKENYMIRESMQFHFINKGYRDFPDFLTTLKGRKAKQIRSERNHPGIHITQYTQNDLIPDHGRRMYQFYLSTIEDKNSHDYLNEDFFQLLFKNLKENILYVEAKKDDQIVAGSIFFYDHEKLYGRYWGSNAFHAKLHFELCYYQGIDFCLKNNLKVFEAGAQGIHKIARGFIPVKTYSAHKIKHEAFSEAISQFIQAEKTQNELAIIEYSKLLPFKV